MKRRLILLGIPLVIVIVFTALYIGDSYVPFDPIEWRNSRLSSSSIFTRAFEPRKRMFRRLKRQYKIVGMSREQLLQLLGPEDDPRGAAAGEWGYHTGSGILLYSEYAIFRFQNGKVVSYELTLLD